MPSVSGDDLVERQITTEFVCGLQTGKATATTSTSSPTPTSTPTLTFQNL